MPTKKKSPAPKKKSSAPISKRPQQYRVELDVTLYASNPKKAIQKALPLLTEILKKHLPDCPIAGIDTMGCAGKMIDTRKDPTDPTLTWKGYYGISETMDY